MKLINDNNGYMTSVLVLLLLIPLILLLIITIEQDNYYANKTADNIQSNRLNSITMDFQEEIATTAKEVMHNVTLSVIKENQPLQNSNETITKLIKTKINQKQIEYKNNTGCIINCDIKGVKPLKNDPFQIELSYSINSHYNNESYIDKTLATTVSLTDEKYPVYDPLPTLRTSSQPQNNIINYSQNLANIISLNNSQAYSNSIGEVIIKRCPYEGYAKHSNSNATFIDCISNQYYHESHDGLCIMCRLENKTSCSDYGFETFIIPTQLVDEAPVSVDHVLLNTSVGGQYSGKQYLIDNNTVLYLDNGHKKKYGL